LARLTWLGHSFFKIETERARVLVDPWVSNPLFPRGYEVGDFDLVVITHGHGDHLGEAVPLLKSNKKAKAVCVYELGIALEEQGVERSQVLSGNIGGPIRTHVEGVEVVLTPAAHSSGSGVATGAIIITPEIRVYHAGDTGLTYDMSLYADIYKPEVFLVPIGGHYTMDPYQAAVAVKLVKPKVAIPMHYGTFPVLYGKPEEFERYVRELSPSTAVRVLQPGETLEL